jgi:hypothetical protein
MNLHQQIYTRSPIASLPVSEEIIVEERIEDASKIFSTTHPITDYELKILLAGAAPSDFEGWIIPEPSADWFDTNASQISGIVVTNVSLGSLTTIYPLGIYTPAQEEVDTKTRRRVSLREAAKIARAIYYETLAKEEKARELEAANWQPFDDGSD